MGENLNGNWGNQQPLEQQHHENAQNGSNQCSSDEMTIEDILVRYGIVKKANNSSVTTSSQPSPPTKSNTSSLPTHQIGGSMGEKQSNQQSCAQNDSCQTSHEGVMSFEDFLVQSGVLPKEFSSDTTSFKPPPPPPPPYYDPSSLQVGAAGTSVSPMESSAAHKDHQSHESMKSGVDQRRVGHEDHQTPGNIMSQVCPTGGRMETMGTGVQQTEVGGGDQLGRAMRGVSLEGMRHGGGGASSGIEGIEGQQLGAGSSVSAMAVDDLIIEPEPYNAKRMGEGEASGNKKCKEAKTDKETEKKKKNMIKNRESASRSRARKEAYKMELERTVSQLTEENARLKRDLEELKAKPAEHNKAGKAGALRRCNSCLY